MKIIHKIIELSKPYWTRVIAGIILGLGVSAVTGAIAWLVKPALDVVFIDKKYEYFKYIPAGVFLLISAKGALHFGQTYLMNSAGLRLIRDLQNRIHKHILHMPITYFHKESSGVLISRTTNDAKLLGSIFSGVIRTLLIEVPTIFVLLGIALYRKWDLTLLSILLVPLIAYNTRKIGKKIKKRSREAQSKISYLTQRLSETIIGAKIIKIFNREDYRDLRFIEENMRVYKESAKVVKLKEATKLMIEVITGIAIGLVLWYGGSQVKNGVITSGDFASIIAAIYLIFTPVKKLGESYSLLQEIRAAIERIETVLDVKKEAGGKIIINEIKQGISFENISFRYSLKEPFVLKNINFYMQKGEVIAIVGPSGTGKTTFVDLIPRFFDPTEGIIKIDGVNVKEIELKSLRSIIGIVSQDVILFNDTIKENIAFGNEHAEFDSIKKAAEMAYANEFIEKFPEGYDTVIGERGLKLSGGQRQRIAIARAILKDPPLLILDEATSSLDAVSERLVQKALEMLMKNRTTIIIAHRLSTIKNADRIIVLENGEVVDAGSHEYLLSKGGMYSELCKAFVHN